MSFNQPSFDQQLNDQFERVTKTLSQILPKLLPIAVVVIAALWLASGIYSVHPGHVGVERTFGKETARTEPGLNYRFPWPFQRADVVSVEQIRRIEVGFRGAQRVHEEALMLTGDENIVEAQIVVQYRVADPSKYLFRLREPEVALVAATEVALRSTVGSMTIDQVMIEERAKVQDDARVFIQRLMDTYESGLVITEVKLQAADPPDAVRDAFHDVVRAREDKEKLINQARGYQADILPKARGEAQKILREAEGYKEKRVLLATLDVHQADPRVGFAADLEHGSIKCEAGNIIDNFCPCFQSLSSNLGLRRVNGNRHLKSPGKSPDHGDRPPQFFVQRYGLGARPR